MYGEISFAQIRHLELLVEAMKDSRKVITDYNLQYKLKFFTLHLVNLT